MRFRVFLQTESAGTKVSADLFGLLSTNKPPVQLGVDKKTLVYENTTYCDNLKVNWQSQKNEQEVVVM